ncbi:MAG: alpha/beta hydrolase, partial [Candidatus Omnitrophica bacterium]|nr:alpha/beta hydrolase [Candidatus Omnitrophota bacterium]
MVHYFSTKKIMLILLNGFIVVGVALLALVLFLKYFEKTGIFFPSRDITVTPSAVGVNFEEVMIPSGSETINAWFLEGPVSSPVILFCHGNAGNIGDRVLLLKLFSDAGFGVLIFDYRGYGK